MIPENNYRIDLPPKWIVSNLDELVIKLFATDPNAISVEFAGISDCGATVFFFDRGTDDETIRQDCAEKVAKITVIGSRLLVLKDGEAWACESQPLAFLHPNHRNWVEAVFAKYDEDDVLGEWSCPYPASVLSAMAGGGAIRPDLSFFQIMLGDGVAQVDVLFDTATYGLAGHRLITFHPDSDLARIATLYTMMLESGAQPRAYRTVMADGTERAVLFPPSDDATAEDEALRIIRQCVTDTEQN
jgi:hypothetical protein